MRTRVLALVWLGMGIAVWSGMFDLYIARGADRYLWKKAEFELKLMQAEPSMAAMMADTRRDAAIKSSIWAVLVTGLGWTTVALARRR
jgi:hypothetical protein